MYFAWRSGMTRLLARTALLTLLAAPFAFAQSDPFTVTLPAGFPAFTKQVQNVKSPQGDIETTNWVSKSPTGEAVIITLSKLPAKITDPAKLIASSRDSLIKSLNATLDSSSGNDALFHSSAAVFRGHLAAADDHRLFQVLYVGRTPEQRNQASVGQLFDSFKVAP
jgi:hypothetical protein